MVTRVGVAREQVRDRIASRSGRRRLRRGGSGSGGGGRLRVVCPEVQVLLLQLLRRR